jgi:hypothetical protein
LAWEKLNKYYTLAEFNPVLYAAVVLHPSMKMEYFETAWSEHPDWIAAATKAIQDLWEHDYKPKEFSRLQTSSSQYQDSALSS